MNATANDGSAATRPTAEDAARRGDGAGRPEPQRYDMRHPEYLGCVEEMHRSAMLCHRYNQAEPFGAESRALLDELFGGRLDATSYVQAPLNIDVADNVSIGRHVFINNNLICMSRGGVTIEDGVMIGPGVSLLTANHEFDDHMVLLCSPIHIGRNAWIGARAIILPGITIGRNAVVAAGAVVTRDVEENTVVGGNPARVLKRLEPGPDARDVADADTPWGGAASAAAGSASDAA